ncbi:KAP family NTPase [Streptomyces lydicus]|uniref:P-loop NTPase fold protein n=1 Tax=Streptomyces lydicus TaxID=47763 RepID=UPI002E329A63|nr:P-loop NTPase fold protein [Streptomyces lydicus]
MAGARFFNDEPFLDHAEGPDLLGHRQYAQHVISLLDRVRAQTETGVLAMIGPWGSGKSSVLGRVTRRLRETVNDDGWLVAELNPWLYSDLESLTLALFSEIREALPNDGRWSDAREKIGGFGKAISPLGKVTALFGLDSEGLIQEVSNRISGDTSASAAKHKAEEALRKAGHPVLVVMDDLDRLTPEELLVVFKLVRLVGHLPNVYYLISFDEQTLLDVLERSKLVGNSEPRARDFLEKIIQVRLDLPAFRERDADILVDRSLGAVLASHSLTLTLSEQERLSEVYYRHLQARLRTPRAIKRFFGQVDATLGQLTGNVDIVDFLIVTFLRTSEPRAYRLLWQHRAELTGTSMALPSRRDERPEQRIDRWRTRLRDAGVAEQHLDGVIGLMGVLFTPVRQALGHGINLQAIAQRRGIGSIDYFDRYMVFGIPDDDLPERIFDTALQQLADGTPGTEADELLLRLRDDTQRITRRIGYKRAAGTPLPAAALLKAAAPHYGHLTAAPQGALGLITADRAMDVLARDLLTDLAEPDRPSILKTMAETPDGAVLAARALQRVTSRNDSDSPDRTQASATLDWIGEACSLISQEIARHLAPSASRPVDELTESEITLLWAWRHTASEATRAWINQRLDEAWTPLGLLAVLLPPDRAPFPVIGNDTLQSLDALIGLEALYSRLRPHLDAPAATPDSSQDEHQARILQALREHRDADTATSS